MFQQITVNTNKIYQLDFLKVIVLSWSTKAAITGSFRRVPCSLSSIIKKSANSIGTLSQSSCFKSLKESNDRLFS